MGYLSGWVLFGLLIVPSFSVKAPPHTRSDAQPNAAQSLPFTPQFISMHVRSPSQHWPTIPVGALRPAGITWGAVEPSRGVFDWHGVDSWVAQAGTHHVQLDYLFLNTPQWASTHPNERCNRGNNGCAAPPRDADWTQFITELVTRYKGRIADYEMWNEPNSIGYFTGTPAEMAHLVSLAYPIIKSIDPQATVVSPSPSSTGWPIPYAVWMDQFLKAGGGRYVDVIAWHSYASYTNKPARPPEDVASQIMSIRSVMAKNGASNLPLWDTEGSWGTNTSLPDQEQQATFLARWYLIQFSYGVARVYWYQWDSPTVGTLWTEANGMTPAGNALAQVYDLLNGVTGATPCTSTADSIWTCDLFKGTTKIRAVWSASGPVAFSNYAGFSTYSDLSGATHPVNGQPVMVDSSPIFFR
jgi:hypothetical protein